VRNLRSFIELPPHSHVFTDWKTANVFFSVRQTSIDG
jgi:hypothetical protein